MYELCGFMMCFISILLKKKQPEDTKKLYDEAMRNGYVDREIIKCLIIGAAGVGKTTLKHLLLGNEPPEKRVSTGVLENPVRAVSISMAGESSSGSWCKVESDEELMKMIAEAIKSGKVPKKNISVGSQQNDAVAEHNDDIMLPATDIESSTVRPADVHIEPEYNVKSIHSEFIEAINNSKGTCISYKSANFSVGWLKTGVFQCIFSQN